VDEEILNWKKKKQEYLELERVDRNRVSFENYFIGLAFAIATRSMDAQTRHGTLLVDKHKHIVSTGYNSFPRKMPDSLLPNLRPEKYKWMKHSEINALSNLTINLWQNSGVTAFITGTPCFSCLTTLFNSGIEDFCIADRAGWSMDEKEKESWDFFIYESKINIKVIKPNLNWLKDLVEELKTYGFITE
jgi:deoxycytidylate deaminase